MFRALGLGLRVYLDPKAMAKNLLFYTFLGAGMTCHVCKFQGMIGLGYRAGDCGFGILEQGIPNVGLNLM